MNDELRAMKPSARIEWAAGALLSSPVEKEPHVAEVLPILLETASELKERERGIFRHLSIRGIASFVLLTLVALLAFGVFDQVGAARPGALIEKASYRATSLVHARRFLRVDATCTLRADIERYNGEYFIHALHFPDGGVARFDDGDYVSSLKTWADFTDTDGDSWQIKIADP